MQPAPTTTTEEKSPQHRLRRFERQPERLAGRQLTDKGCEVIATIERYRFLPSSLLVRLVEGGQRNNYRHLQTLFHKGLINRFALPTTYGTPGEFVYYLDDPKQTLSVLAAAGLLNVSEEERRKKAEQIATNREKNYAGLHKDPDMQGKLMFLQHELMVSRFHALLDLACRKFTGKVILEQWKHGPELWNRVQVPKVRHLGKDPQTGRMLWQELHELEYLPHRPDAFFTLYFPSKPEGQQRSHFLYEADRGTENTTRFKMKLRAHWQFIVKQHRQRTTPCYNVHGIRAVLIESTDMHWAHNLREAAKEPLVSSSPSALFWFTTSELFAKPQTITEGGRERQVPLYLQEPETVFKRIWASPVEDKFLNLAD